MNFRSKKIQHLCWVTLSIFYLLCLGCVALSENQPPQGEAATVYTRSAQENSNFANVTGAPKVALLLPQTGSLAESGEAVRNGFMTAFYNSNKQYAPTSVQVYNSVDDNIKTLYHNAVANGANIIIGPLTKEQVTAIKQTRNVNVPTIALNYSATSSKPDKNLYEFALSPQDEARQVAQKARQSGYSHALIIAPAGNWSEGITNQFISSWESSGGTITEKMLYSNKTNLNKSIKEVLHFVKNSDHKNETNPTSQRRTDIDVIFLVASPSQGRQIVPLLKFYYAGDIPVYSTSMIYGGKPNPMQDKDLDGVLFCEMPWLIDKDAKTEKSYNQMLTLLPNANSQTIRLYAFGMDAYQLAMQLYYQGLTPNTSIQGVTGQLYVSEPEQQIYRRLKWAKFRGGIPKQVS